MVVGMDGAVRAQPFLDIHSLISTGSERGLLSVAFHPDYTSNGYFFVDYTNVDGTVIVARYHVSQNDPDRADPASAHIILPVPHPVENHNGGLLLFGPDGYLYVGIGDGGTGNSGNGQRKGVLLGKILRIDVNHTTGRQQYAIPPDNPFANQPGTRPEIWAYGLRNPWRPATLPTRRQSALRTTEAGSNSCRRATFSNASGWGKLRCLPSSTTSVFLLTTTWRKGIFGCSKSSKRSRAASVLAVVAPRSATSEDICPVLASKGSNG